VQTRRVYIGSSGGWLEAQIFQRDALEPGFSGTGPAVIEEYGSTTLVWPGDRFEIGQLHEIRIKCCQN
jgi:N-methylhydantoinase A